MLLNPTRNSGKDALRYVPEEKLSGCFSEALNHLRQNAEEDLSNILHIQSTLPSASK